MILYSGRGSEYTAARYQELCGRLGVVQSMGRLGCALADAASEAFNSTLKVEYVPGQVRLAGSTLSGTAISPYSFDLGLAT